MIKLIDRMNQGFSIALFIRPNPRGKGQFIVKHGFPLDSSLVLYYNILAESIHSCCIPVITSDNEMITGAQAGRMAEILQRIRATT